VELVLVPGADHELAVEPSLAERPADVIAEVGNHAELAVLERDGNQAFAELCFAQRRALEIVRRADVDPLPRARGTRLVHVLLRKTFEWRK
jgi:hypothetical protein